MPASGSTPHRARSGLQVLRRYVGPSIAPRSDAGFPTRICCALCSKRWKLRVADWASLELSGRHLSPLVSRARRGALHNPGLAALLPGLQGLPAPRYQRPGSGAVSTVSVWCIVRAASTSTIRTVQFPIGSVNASGNWHVTSPRCTAMLVVKVGMTVPSVRLPQHGRYACPRTWSQPALW